MNALIICVVGCICVTLLGLFEIVAGSACVGVIMAAMGFIAGNHVGKNDTRVTRE